MLALSTVLQYASSMPDFNNNHIRKENTDIRNKNSVFKAPRCSMDEIGSIIGIRELQEIVERFAEKTDINPYMILKKLFERMKSRKSSNDAFLNTLEGADLQQMLQPKLDVKPTVAQLPPLPSIIPYEVPPANHDSTKPFLVGPHHISSSSDDGRSIMTQFVPLMSPFNQPFIPPEPAVVRVTSLPDIPVTVSPFMTVIEALRQADNEYRAALGIKTKIGFGRSVIHGVECVVIKHILDLFENQDYTWKITVADRNGQVLYHDICLPDGKKVRVRPGTDITISYVPQLD